MDELMAKIAILRETKLFKGLTLDVLQEMACRVHRKKMQKGEEIFKEGDIPHGFYVISSGEVILHKGEQRLAVLSENDFFGEMGLLSDNPRAATAVAGKEGVLLFLDNETFNTFVVSYPEVLSIVIHKVIHDLEQSDEPERFIKSHAFHSSALAKAEKMMPFSEENETAECREKFHVLRNVPLFKGLTDKTLLPIAKMTEWKKASKGEVVFSKGDEPDYMYIISQGSVVIKKGNEELTLLNGHDFFGEAGVASNQPRLASAVAVEDCIFLALSKADFKSILSIYPAIAKSILFKIVSYHYPNYQDQSPDTLFQIENFLPYQDHSLDAQLFFESLGLSKSKAVTVLELYRIIKSEHTYYIDEKGLHENKELDKNVSIRDLEAPALHEVTPKYIEVHGVWYDPQEAQKGTIRKFITKIDAVNIPVEEATEASLAYYGAKLLDKDEVFKVKEEGLPVWNILIGDEYFKHFIQSEKGGGVHLEWQEDKPHFHMPANKLSHGYYVLGKKAITDDKIPTYHFTAFQIPFGKAVYTPRGVIHLDVALQGNWLIGCGNAKKSSSVVMMTETNKIVKVDFEHTNPLVQNKIFISIYPKS